MKTIEIKNYTFEVVNPGTKKAGYIHSDFNKAKNNGLVSLWQLYDRFSNKKQVAYNLCAKMCTELSGSSFYLVCGSSYTFTVVFTFEYDNKKYICLITKKHNYITEL